MSRVILFDVNETLLDLQALNPTFDRIFGDAGATSLWFTLLLRSAMVATIAGPYHNFETLGADALAMVATKRGVDLNSEDLKLVLEQMRQLPPHPEVLDALTMLHNAGLRLATLTNSPLPVLNDQLTNAGLNHLFEQTLSVDHVQRFKPAPETYRYAADALDVDVRDLRLVAAHDWDIAGAMRAGCAGAFVARPGMILGPLQAAPDIIGADMTEVARAILEVDVM